MRSDATTAKSATCRALPLATPRLRQPLVPVPSSSLAKPRQSTFGYIFLGCDKTATQLACDLDLYHSAHQVGHGGWFVSDFYPVFYRNYRPGRCFSRKRTRGRNTSLSPAYESLNERAKWFGRQLVQQNLCLRKGKES